MYGLDAYGEMIADRVRVNAYAQALRAVIRPGSVVVDIGTGPGVMAVLACQLGASRVFAIEPGPIIQVAREIAAANHCVDRIEFCEALSTEVALPTPADVIVSDLRGLLPVFPGHIPAIVDARGRFLAPGGAMIPRKDRVWLAVAEIPETYAKYVGPWESNALSQDLSRARRLAVNRMRGTRAGAHQLLSKPELWATLDYTTIVDGDFQGDLYWTIQRGGTGCGLLAWFDADLAEGVGFSTAPGAPETVYQSAFFPWTQPVAVVPQQTVRARLEAKMVGIEYVWRWDTEIEPAKGSGSPCVRFEQSKLHGELFSLAALRRQAASYLPHLSDAGRTQRRTLEMMDGQTPLEEIARRLLLEFPQRFAGLQEALSYAAGISSNLSE